MSGKGSPEQVDVIIAGLGPTGLVLAHLLGRRGHRVVVLERELVFYGNARAVHTDDECMRVFQAAEVADELQRRMLRDTPCQWVAPDGRVMARTCPTRRPFGWPVVNFFYQPYLETTLAERLSRYPNVEVRRGRELTALSEDPDGVRVVHQATRTLRYTDSSDARVAAGRPLDPRELRARYLIGADGGRSAVRTLLGVEMTGESFPEPWLVVDLKATSPDASGLRHVPCFNFYCDRECPAVSCPQPDGHHRFEFMLTPGETREHMEEPETVRRYLSRYVDPDRFEVKRRLVYTFKAVIARRWRVGRTLLAGDAAHMMPQFMGQGMGSGVRDAYNLAWKLDLVLRGLASDALLDSYQTERHDHAKRMIDVSVLMKDAVAASTPVRAAVRDAFAAMIRWIPQLREYVREGRFKPSPTYGPGYFGVPRKRRSDLEGRMVPQPEVRRIDGRRMLLDEALGEGFALIGVGLDPRATLSNRARAFLDSVDASFVALYAVGGRPQGPSGVARERPEGLEEVEDVDGELLAWFRRADVGAGAVALVRPDKFLFAIARAPELNAIVDELRARLSLSTVRAPLPAVRSCGRRPPAGRSRPVRR
ncbi:bifunctional 3-(3-hydroxy-phenyl)propionate/3-hydroxycinnamic acid hydroxylase [Sorangium sp. So ce854]|uniref:bifunctional 3-(3-hydroxy-phenyl)propionate/3-hydroxycinnamic acid hydroxylase MhpA n=1 Tax=Sorangium sp. So ce854 TaxID=3133322 RepID=UPI003F5F7265